MKRKLRAIVWKNLLDLRLSKVFLGNINKKIARTMIKESRNKVCVLVRFVTGHCHLGKHNTRLGLTHNSERGLRGADD